MKLNLLSNLKLLLVGVTLPKRSVIHMNATAFIRSKELLMTSDEYLVRHPNPAVRFIGEFKGEQLGQFDVRAYSSKKLHSTGLKTLSFFQGHVKELTEEKLIVISTQRLTSTGKLGHWTIMLLHAILFIFAIMHVDLTDPSTLFFPTTIVFSWTVITLFLIHKLHAHHRFFEYWFLHD